MIRVEEIDSYTLQQIKDLILKYKVEKDPGIFEVLLVKFDRLIVYICSDLKRKFEFIRSTSDAELYHTAVIAVHKSFISMPESWKLHQICIRMKSYIKREFFKEYNRPYLNSRKTNSINEKTQSKVSYDKKKIEDTISCFMILNSGLITKEEKELVEKKIMRNETYDDLRKEYNGITKQAIWHKVKLIVNKLKRKVK